MVDKAFLKYIDDANKQYKDYQKLEGSRNFTFNEFLMLILLWKVEGILESVEKREE